MIPRDFHFSYFYNAWHLLWLLPLILLFIYSFWKRQQNADKLVDDKLQSKVLIPRDTLLTGLKLLCFGLGWSFAVLALMGPLGNEYYQATSDAQVKRPPSIDLIFLMDVSTSMAVKDMRNQKTRWSVAEEVADKLISKLRSDPVAIFAFTSKLVPIVPMTLDRTFARLMLREIQFNEENNFGTNFTKVFQQLKTHIDENYPKSAKAIVLFSDGEDTGKTASQAILDAAIRLNTPIFTVGVGTIAGGEVPDVLQNGQKVVSKLDEALLLELSQKTGGRYFSAQDQSPIDLASRINQSLERPRNTMSASDSSDASGSYHYYFQIPLGLALLFLSLYFLLPSAKRVLLLLVFAFHANAVDVGKTLFDSGQYAESAAWYEGELKHLPPEWLRNKLLYNMGTSLMEEKEWEEADRAFFAVSKEAYSYPLFRLRLLYNQLLILWFKPDNVRENLTDALFILSLVEHEKCDTDCPESLLRDLEEKIKARLDQLPEDETKENPYREVSRQVRIFRLASLLPKLSESSLETLKKLTEIQTSLSQTAFLLEQKKRELATTPAMLLESLIDEIPLASELKGQESALLNDGKSFYPFILNWQKKQFSKGVCQCAPWAEVIPPFTDGLRALDAPPFEEQLFYTYDKWLEALNKLNTDTSESQQPQKQEDEDLRELQEMQTLDKQKDKAKMQPIGEGMPW